MRRKEKTHYVIVLDQSGSMDGIKNTVISSFNEQLQSLQKQSKEMDIEVTLSVFNDTTTLLNLSSKIGDIKKLNNKNVDKSCILLKQIIERCVFNIF